MTNVGKNRKSAEIPLTWVLEAVFLKWVHYRIFVVCLFVCVDAFIRVGNFVRDSNNKLLK